MFTIWKSALQPGMTIIALPKGSKFLHVGVQQEQPQVWSLVPIDEPVIENRTIVSYATGQLIAIPGNYLGTFLMHGGSLVFHAFELKA